MNLPEGVPAIAEVCYRRRRHTWIGEGNNRLCLVCSTRPSEESDDRDPAAAATQ